jgi:hypothetical protein
MRALLRIAVMCLAITGLSAVAYGQAAITGVVKDSSGALLPGVTVETSSPVLIEKVRAATTDGTGQYRITDLRPGVYAVTFTLPGFSTIKREGIELTGTFVATVNADMRVGELAETITVTGETPIVDVQSAKQQTTLNKDVLSTIPNGRQISNIAGLIPGMSARPDVGGSTTNVSTTAGTIHGGQGNDTRSFVDGMNIGWNGSANNQIMPPLASAQEVVISTSGGLGEAETGGVLMNIVPREGSNAFHGSFVGNFANGSMQGHNYGSELQAQGLSAPNRVVTNYDLNPMFGGRIITDRVWFYLSARRFVQENTVAGLFYNQNPQTAWIYTPDLSRQATTDTLTTSGAVRLTFQVTPRNKVNVAWDEQGRCVNCDGGGSLGIGPFAGASPEAAARNYAAPTRLQQVTYQSPISSSVLLDGGFGTYLQRYGERPRRDGYYDPSLVAAINNGSAFPTILFRSPTLYWNDWVGSYSWRASVAYVSGSHNLKVGYQDARFNGTRNRYPNNPNNPINTYTFTGFRADGSPNPTSITVGAPITSRFVLHPLGLYAQDSWTRGRLTLQGGIRFDGTTSNFGADPHFALDERYPQIGPSPLIPVAIQITDPDLLRGVNFKDVTPRGAAAYDLFGNGRTALKASFGKYVRTLTGDGDPLDMNPVNRVLNTGGPGGTTPFGTTRAWNDANGNLVPECDLANPAANGECGAYANQIFGNLIRGQVAFTNNFDPAVIRGWGVRPYEWDVSAAVQQQLSPRLSVEVGYFRRWYGNFLVQNNRAVEATDFDPFSVTLTDSKLPGGSATVSGLYNVTPAKFGQINNIVMAAENFGKQIQHWNGVDTSINGRMAGVTFRVGSSTGRTSTNSCEIRQALPESAPTNPFCAVNNPFLTDVRGFASYTVPKADVLLSVNVFSIPGALLPANANLLNAQIAPSLGRNLSGNAALIPQVNLLHPETQPIGDRTNQVDIRIAKVFRYLGRANVGLDLYNVTNANTVQTYNQTFNAAIPTGQRGAWLQPTSILAPRLAKISVTYDF